MKFELDRKDLSDLSRVEYLLSTIDDDDVGRAHLRIARVIRKINSQIPDKAPVGAIRRIRIRS